MDEATFLAAVEGTEKHYDVSCRQVVNGFALGGNVRYVVPGTSNVKVAQSFEAVALDNDSAAAAITKFLSTGAFA